MEKTNCCIIILIVLITKLNFEVRAQAPLFPNSVTSNDIDFITEADPDTYDSFVFLGLADKEMPGDPSGGGLFDTDTYVFEILFSDGETLEVWCHSAFGSEAAAQEYTEKLGPRLGKLPPFQRNMLNHVVIHKGDGGAFAEIEGQFFILYSDNMDARISTNDLEETVFHESVHASYQFMYQDSPDWLNAQAADPTFVTEYAQDNPAVEDIAESALFAYTYLTYPDRLSSEIETWLEENIPNRLEFFRAFYLQTTDTERIENQAYLKVSPNPTNDRFRVQSNEVNLSGTIRILNIRGESVHSVFCSDRESVEIDLTKFENGLYLISFPGYQNAKILKFR